jgi:hypothetical protein
MRGTIAGLMVAVLILIGLGLKAIFVSSAPANSETISGSMSGGMSTYDLHLNHPDMKNLPRQAAPAP